MGDIVNWHFVAVPLRPAFSHKITFIEDEGKIFFKKDFRLGRDGIAPTEYIPKDIVEVFMISQSQYGISLSISNYGEDTWIEWDDDPLRHKFKPIKKYPGLYYCFWY
jgi:hypothetical protein